MDLTSIALPLLLLVAALAALVWGVALLTQTVDALGEPLAPSQLSAEDVHLAHEEMSRRR